MTDFEFFVGCHQPSDAEFFPRSFISVKRLEGRKSGFRCHDWVLDSGAFTEVTTHGGYRHSVEDYARQASMWVGNGNLRAIVAQDYMCEPFAVAKTGLTIAEHQRLTIERYDELQRYNIGAYVMPVLQGYLPEQYAAHVRQYAERLSHGQWVGVGSVCKRQGTPWKIVAVLEAIRHERPDLRLHGFGVKVTSLRHAGVRALLDTADSMAWSAAARWQGRNGNDWREGHRFRLDVESAARRPGARQQGLFR